MKIGTSTEESSFLNLNINMQYQKGYVPIKRANREDLLVQKYLLSRGISRPATSNPNGYHISDDLQNIPLKTCNESTHLKFLLDQIA